MNVKSRILCLLLCLLLIPSLSLAWEVDLDLTDLVAMNLYDRLMEIRYSPEAYLGKTIRVRGQYYGTVSALDGRVCPTLVHMGSATCCEVGIELFAGENPEMVWPENNAAIEVVARVERVETDGIARTRLYVFQLKIL